MTTVRALLFDFGGTLDVPAHWLDRFLAHYRAAGFEISRTELEHAFDHATKAAYAATGLIRGWGLTETVGFLVGRQLEHLRSEGPARMRESLARMGEGARHRIRDRIAAEFTEESAAGMTRSRRIIEKLKPHFRLGVVSNFYGNLERVLDDAGMRGLMDVIVDSSQVGIFKPDPRIYEKTIAALGVSDLRHQTVMTGDSLSKDCAPAHRLGMKTIWLCANGASVPEPQTDFVDRKIHALDELLKLEWASI